MTSTVSGIALMEAGQAALDQGDSRQGFELLEKACEVGVEPEHLHRLAHSYATAARFQGRQAEVLDWIERVIGEATEQQPDAGRLSALLRARVAVCRLLDLHRVGLLVEDALAAAEAVSDEEAYAGVLADASFAAYRRGDARAASKYAERARARVFSSPFAKYAALRAQMFAVMVVGDIEQALALALRARAMAHDTNSSADEANESNNLAELYLELGRPAGALACANQAVELARASGDRAVEQFGRVMAAMAAAEAGEIDEAIERFSSIDWIDRILSVDAAAAHSYWLLERGAAGDAQAACQIATAALVHAERAGVFNRVTLLYSNIARSYARQGQAQAAVEALEQARRAADRAEVAAQLLLALAMAEVLPVTDTKRQMVLNHARARILRNAERRDDPRAYCADVRLNRRLLELTGGVPTDLPRSR